MRRFLIAVVLVTGCGATRVKVDPVKVQPIHITVDVNLKDSSRAPTGEGKAP